MVLDAKFFHERFTKPRTICTRCIFDDLVPNINFDADGVCNYCRMIEGLEREYPNGEEGKIRLANMIADIRRAGRGKKYDCIIGVSGGCDSSYLVHTMVEQGVRPLAVHFDNTWDSAIATQNISRVLGKLNVDLFTIVVDNKEAAAICRSFMLAGVPDIEAFTDVALAATMNIAAAKHRIRYVVEGHSFRTEGVSPLGWLYFDGKYVDSVVRQFSNFRLKTYPNIWFSSFMKWMLFNRIKKVRPLYHMDYNKEEVKAMLKERYGWEWYGGHHLENRYTAFFHSYFMPRRFGIDLRLNGFAALVRCGQLKREEALRELLSPPHLEEEVLALVKKRLGFSDEEFEQVMDLPKKTYRDYRTYKPLFEKLRPFFWVMYKLELVPKSFFMKYTVKHEPA